MDKIEFRIAFGKRIEKFRKELGLSYRELAQKCDVDHSNIRCRGFVIRDFNFYILKVFAKDVLGR